MAMRSTMAADGLVLADDAGGEVAADGGEIDALVAVEDRDRQAGELRQGLDDVARRDGGAAALGRATDAELDEVEQRRREGMRR